MPALQYNVNRVIPDDHLPDPGTRLGFCEKRVELYCFHQALGDQFNHIIRWCLRCHELLLLNYVFLTLVIVTLKIYQGIVCSFQSLINPGVVIRPPVGLVIAPRVIQQLSHFHYYLVHDPLLLV